MFHQEIAASSRGEIVLQPERALARSATASQDARNARRSTGLWNARETRTMCV
jgi:hypothetical protein